MRAPKRGTQRNLYSTCSRWALYTRDGLARLGIGSARLFGYQHVGISNTKSLRWGSDLQAKKQPKNYKFYTLLACSCSCGKGIRISTIDQINIITTCLNLLNHMKFVTIKVD